MSATKGLKIARPVLSRTPEEARRRVMNLYRAWYRQIPFLLKDYGFTSVTASESELRHKLREEFMKHKDVKDIRVIDLLVHRGKNELLEVAHMWSSDTHVMDIFRETVTEKPKDFLGKFLSGQ